jgi:hypothetical protein
VPTVEFIEPTISNAAADAGRPKPRIIAVVPALVSDDVDAAHAVAAWTRTRCPRPEGLLGEHRG